MPPTITPRRSDNTNRQHNTSTPVSERRLVKWEYRNALLDNDADLTQFGEEGWECYSVLPVFPVVSGHSLFYFKRRMM
jgi:hypothetical protein